MTPGEKIEAVQQLYLKGELTAEDVRKVLDGPGVIGPIVNSPPPAQKFFEELAASTRVPHYGEKQRDWMNQLLKRATEANLYTPEKT